MWGWPREVRALDRRRWTIGIRWLPRRPKWAGWGFGWRRKRREGASSRWWDGVEAPDDGGLIVVGVIVAVLLAWFFVFPVLFFVLDVLLVVLIAGAGIAARVLFRRPWIVEARSGDETLTWAVVGWRAARQRVDHVATRLQCGLPLDDLPAPL